ncbi:glutamate receptor 2.9-like [Typha latifolia]|uniref:glutamate receptor 2.9-like n=1 Tax=Typha latifolia TaxID=4733 RepID=UPI003C2ADD47
MRLTYLQLRELWFPFLLLLCSLSISPLQWASVRVAAQEKSTTTTQVDVGVILNTSTYIGSISWTCMLLAVEDFYAAHPNYNTRISLQLRDTETDVLSAAAAAVDLLQNVHVQAVIGPQTSTQAKFIAELGNRTQVPVISFSATSPLSSSHSPFFIRTAWNDSSQVKVIASIIQSFSWREVVLVLEDSEYGDGIAPYLVDALQEVGAHVPYRCKIPISATDKQIKTVLSNLNNSQTRVFLVHMSFSLAFQFFRNARDAQMMEHGYVWMTTYGLTDVVDLIGSSAVEVMKGVLGIKPYVRETNKLEEFRERWREKYKIEYPNSSITEPTVFGLWAYDTVWSVAIAAEGVGAMSSTSPDSNTTKISSNLARIGTSKTGKKLRDLMLNINFNGMSGNFHLVDGQLESSTYEIVNVLGHGTGRRRVGFWTPTYGISGHIRSKTDLRVITWPGGDKTAPKGWQWPTSGKLIIGVPVKPGYGQFIRQDENGTFRGYCIDVFEAVMKALPYNVPFEYKAYKDVKGASNGTYDELIYHVYLKDFDAVVGDVTIRANRSLYVDFTLPYTESGVSMLVPIKDKSHKDAWTFLQPFSTGLWLATGASFVFTGLVVWFIEHRTNEEFRGPPLQQFGSVFYFSFSTLVFSHREKILNNLSRIVVIVWFFVVLIVQQSYTASLSSMLTMEQLQPTVTNLEEVIRNGRFVGYLNDSFIPGLLKQFNFDESKLIAYNSPEDYNEGLSNGSVAAVVDEIPYLKVFLSKYCKNYTMVGPTYKTGGFGFVFPKGSPLVPDVSRAILTVTQSNKMVQFEKMLYKNQSCANWGDTTVTSSNLNFNSFWGLFLITGVSSTFALFVFAVLFLRAHRHILMNDDAENSVCQKFVALAKLYDQMDISSHASKNAEQVEPQLTTDLPDSRFLTPPGISDHMHRDFYSDSDTGTPLGEEGTPGREIASQVLDPLSFSEMLNGRSQ